MMNSLADYKAFKLKNVTKADLKLLGYQMTERRHRGFLDQDYLEFILVPLNNSWHDGVEIIAELTAVFPAVRSLLSEVIDFAGGMDVSYELRLYPNQKQWLETQRIAISRPISLGSYFILNQLMLVITTSTSSLDITLNGATQIGGRQINFSTALHTDDAAIEVDFGAPGGFPSLGEILTHVMKEQARDVIKAIGNIFDIRLYQMKVVFDYGAPALRYIGLHGEITLGAFVFAAFFAYPQISFHGDLASGCRPSFAEIAVHFGIRSYPAGLETLWVDEASVIAEPGDAYYRIKSMISGELELGNLLTLTSLGLGLEYMGGSWGASFSSSLVIGEDLHMAFSGQFGREGLVLAGSACLYGGEEAFWDLFTGIEIPPWLRKLSLSAVSVQYENQALSVGVVFAYAGAVIRLSLDLAGEAVTIGGVMELSGREFQLQYISEGNISLLYGVFNSEKEPLMISPGLIGLPGELSLQAKKAYLALYGDPSGTITSFGVNLDGELDFSSLPVAGSLLGRQSLKVKEIGVYYNSAAFTGPRQSFLSGHAAACGIKAFDEGLSVSGELVLPGISESEALPLGTAAESSANEEDSQSRGADSSPAARQSGSTAAQPKIKWISINKNLGIINLSRLGIGFEDSALTVLLDAAVTLGCFKCALIEAGVTTPVTEFRPDFKLGGITLDYEAPSVSVTGSIRKTFDGAMEYYYSGGVAVRFSKFGFIAAAAMGKTKALPAGGGGTFLFSLYFAVNATIPVTPAVTITQLSGAFGYNELMRSPTVETADSFPLVTGDFTKLPQWKKPSAGDYWGAAGMKVSVSGILEASLVLLARFGHDLAFEIIGRAEITLPQKAGPDKAYLHAGINVLASLKPREGTFSLTALLRDDSFLFSRQCKLMGGLAFNMWFGNHPHSGEFVFTLGGYHPAFRVPAYYPAVPRLGFLWNISTALSVKGEAYLALTPACVMAGGRLEAVFQSGIVRAWFTAAVDLLMTFRPFSFDAMLKISVGAAVRIKIWKFSYTITLSAGADLHLYGPPTSGTAKIHLSVLTFTISFGAARPGGGDKPLSAAEFRPLLPERLHGINICAGLLGESADKKLAVQAFGASFYVSTAIPAGKINIGPMAQRGIDSILSLQIKRDGTLIYDSGKRSDWILTPVLGNVPKALWGAPLYHGGQFLLAPKQPDADVVPHQVIGYLLEPPEPDRGEAAEYTLTRPSLSAEPHPDLRQSECADERRHSDETRLSFRSRLVPPLRCGEYVFTTSQDVAGLKAAEQMVFTVKSESEIIARYPAPGTSGDFSKVLPHIIFSSPTYPFEKTAKGSGSVTEPWLVLVTLSGEEFAAAVTDGQRITFHSAWLQKILPTHGELPYFTHVRQTDSAAAVSIVLSCRLPLAGSEKVERKTVSASEFESGRAADGCNYACLLALDEVDVEKIPDGKVSFPLLDAWKFFVSAEQEAGFLTAVGGLDQGGAAESIVLKKDGVPVRYHNLFAGKAVPFHRPEVPRFHTSGQVLAAAGGGAAMADAAYAGGEDMPDAAYACAFENARLKLLADSGALQLLFSLRAQMAAAAIRKEQEPSVMDSSVWDGMLGILLAAAAQPVHQDDLKTVLLNSTVERALERGKDFSIPREQNGRYTKEALTFAETVYEIVFQAGDPEAVLFPDGSVIPDESIRFFRIDHNIISAALDGIFSVGIWSEEETALNKVLYRFAADFIWNEKDGRLSGELTGFVLNSTLPEKWRGMEFYAFGADGRELELFEIRELGGTLRLYIYHGVIHNVILREPPQQLCSGLTSDGRLAVKSNGEIRYVPLGRDCFRPGDERTIQALRIAAFSKARNPAQFGLHWLRLPEQVQIAVNYQSAAADKGEW